MNTGSVLAQFTITISKAVSEPVAVEWFTSDGTAKAGVDYAANKGTALFLPGETAKTVDILVYGRAVGTEDRSFFVEMLPPTNAILGAAIGECIIHVDTSGSQPVTQIIVPTGPKGDEGESAYETWLKLPGNAGKTEQEFIDSLKPSAQEIAQEVSPLLDVGDTILTASGTEGLGHPDQMNVKALARRIAYASPAKIATVKLADGDNTLRQADMTGDAVLFSGAGFVPRIWRGSAFTSAAWRLNSDGSITIKGAVAGDVLYACQYDFVADYNSRESVLSVTERSPFRKVKSFEKGTSDILSASDALLWESAPAGQGPYFVWRGAFPKNVPAGSTPLTAGGINDAGWRSVGQASLRDELANGGDKMLGIAQPFTGAVQRTQQQKNAEHVTITDFVSDSTPATDISAAFAAAFAASNVVRVPAGQYTASFQIPSGKKLIGDGKGVTFIDAPAGKPTKQVTAENQSSITIKGISFRSPATAQSSSYEGLLHFVSCAGITLLDVGATKSGNGGIVFVNCDNVKSGKRSLVMGCSVVQNYFEGIICLGENTGIDFINNDISENAHHGVVFKPFAFPFKAGSCHSIKFNNNTVRKNTGHGVFNAGLWNPAMTGDGDLDVTYMRYTSLQNQFMQNSQFNNNTVTDNVATGMILGGAFNTVNDNTCSGNGLLPATGGFAGIVLCGYGMTCNGNTTTNNRTYGIDVGGSQSSSITSNTCMYNSLAEDFCIGLNVGASSNCVVRGNVVGYNGKNVPTCYQILVSGIDGDGAAAFPMIGLVNQISGNTVLCQGNNIGITLRNRTAYNQVCDNLLSGCAFESAIRCEVSQSGVGANIIKNNNLDGAISGVAVPSATVLVIPDWAEFIQLNGTIAVTSLQTTSQAYKAGTITAVNVTNAGTGYKPASKPAVTVTDPTGTGASLHAEVTRDGTILGITVLNPGSNYTNPTITIAPPESGTQAVVTPVLGAVNNVGRELTIYFNGLINFQVTGMKTIFNAQVGSCIRLRGLNNGSWIELSRTV